MTLNIDNMKNKGLQKDLLKYCNDVMHNLLEKDDPEILVVAKLDRSDPRKFTIVADSVFDTQLEGVSLIFDDVEEFKKIFPQFANPPPPVLAPNMELDKRTNKAVPIHKDPYPIQYVISKPKPKNPTINAPENVLNRDKAMTWAVDNREATLVLDLDKDAEIGTVWIAWGDGDKRQYNFTIAVALEEQMEKDNKNKTFTVVDRLAQVWSSGSTDEMEPYSLVTDKDMAVKARYVMVKVYGNTEDGWAKISQVQITKAVALKSKELKEPNSPSKTG